MQDEAPLCSYSRVFLEGSHRVCQRVRILTFLFPFPWREGVLLFPAGMLRVLCGSAAVNRTVRADGTGTSDRAERSGRYLVIPASFHLGTMISKGENI